MENINQYTNRFYTLMESEMGNVKPLISESTLDKGKFESMMEVTPDEKIDDVLNSLVGKDKDEVRSYFLELSNRKPKWLKKLFKKVGKYIKSQGKEIKQALPGFLTLTGIYSLVYMIFKEDVDNFMGDYTRQLK